MYNEKIYLGNDIMNVGEVSTVSIETVSGGELKELQRELLGRLINDSSAVSVSYRQQLAGRMQALLDKYASKIDEVIEARQTICGATVPIYRLGGLDVYGNGIVTRIGDGKIFGVAEHITPAFEKIYQTGSVDSWLVPFLTAGNMQKDVYDVWREYIDAYGILQFVKRDYESSEIQDDSALVIRFVNGAVKKYAGRYAPFDIHQKKEELDRCISAYRRGQQMWFSQTKEDWYYEVRRRFEAEGVLTEQYLTNEEKRAQYDKVRKICLDYLPELTDRQWDISSLWSRYPYHITRQNCESFKRDWWRMNRSYFTLSKGAKGERKVSEVLGYYVDSHRIRVIENYVGSGCEHDFIVITPQGAIFTIEVKSVAGDCILTETGYLKRPDREDGRAKDIVFQSLRHANILRKQLKDCPVFSEAQPPAIKEILCFADSVEPVDDRYHGITVAYPTTLKAALGLDAAKEDAPTQHTFTEEEMDEIERCLRGHQRSNYKYPVFGTHGEIADREAFLHTFADIVSTYRTLQAYYAGYAC